MVFGTPSHADEADDMVDRMSLTDAFLEGWAPTLPTLAEQMIAGLQAANVPFIIRLEKQGEGGLDRFKTILSEELLSELKIELEGVDAAVADVLRAKLNADELAEVKAFAETAAGEKYLSVISSDVQSELQKFSNRMAASVGKSALANARARTEKEMLERPL
jgi:hypothetical protein